MVTIDREASVKFLRGVAIHTDRDVQTRLERFQRSAERWLHSALNWPLDDWEADLRLFVEHTRYAGWEIAPHSIAQLRELLTARAQQSGLFAVGRERRPDRPAIQLAAVMAPGQDTDATLDLTHDDEREVGKPVELEVAGPGPEVSESFKAKVQSILELLDLPVARVWKSEGGIIRSRDASGWRFDYYSERIAGRPAIVVDQSYSAGDTALAILEEAYTSRANPIRSAMLKHWISGDGAAERLREIQAEGYKQAAGEAAMIAELYYGAISSLTPAGDLVVTLDDIDRNGLSLSHALFLLPAMAFAGSKIKGIVLKIAGGVPVKVPKELLDKLAKLPKATLDGLVTKVKKAKTQKEAIGILEQGTKSKLPAKAKPSVKRPSKQSPSTTAPKKVKALGEWKNIPENMRDRARTYQAQITGKRNQVYLVKGVKFDGYKSGILIECKGPGYLNFVRKSDGTFHYWFSAKELKQARDQLTAAAGNPIEWIVAEPELKQALENMFELAKIKGIPVRVVPAR